MKRAGFTLVELLVAIAIIAVLIGLLIPAVQKVRESANRSKCSSNLRQICLAVHSYESVNKYLPPGNVSTDKNSISFQTYPNGGRSTHVFLLPYLEQQAVFEKFTFGKAGDTSPTNWTTAVNRPAYQNRIVVFECPSAPNPRTQSSPGTNAPTADYFVINGVKIGGTSANGTTPSRPTRLVDFDYSQVTQLGMLITPTSVGTRTYYKAKLREVVDGTSNTIMFAERAGAPTLYKLNKDFGLMSSPDGAWAQADSNFFVAGSERDGTNNGGPCSMNCTNAGEIYSFHSSGAYLGFGDGSVRFVDQSLEIQYLYALVTRAAGDPVPELPY